MDGSTAGDPMSKIKYSRKSTYKLSEELGKHNIKISATTTGSLLKEKGYSLKTNRKTIAETHHPDRNQQFQIIADMKKRFTDLGQPILSSDSKKKELIGNFKNAGKIWSKIVEWVYAHDFRSMAEGIANPYGMFDPILNHGTVVVGTSYDTAEFAVESIEKWIISFGWKNYPKMKELLFFCDSGGSNSYRTRLWKLCLYNKIARKYGISVSVCHYPPGASKWNPVEHRLFSFISLNWAGIPLRSYDIMLKYIRNTTTKKGLKVDAFLNRKKYKKGIKINDSEMNAINLKRYQFLPEWNYTISP